MLWAPSLLSTLPRLLQTGPIAPPWIIIYTFPELFWDLLGRCLLLSSLKVLPSLEVYLQSANLRLTLIINCQFLGETAIEFCLKRWVRIVQRCKAGQAGEGGGVGYSHALMVEWVNELMNREGKLPDIYQQTTKQLTAGINFDSRSGGKWG